MHQGSTVCAEEQPHFPLSYLACLRGPSGPKSNLTPCAAQQECALLHCTDEEQRAAAAPYTPSEREFIDGGITRPER